MADKRRELSCSDANASGSRNEKAVSVSSWFGNLKEIVDVMPDQGWYQLPHPKKRMVYQSYKLDCASFPGKYKHCTPGHFNKIWRKQFPECRIRKHCRFAKCEFCVAKRAILDNAKSSAYDRQQARTLLQAHYAWANTRERGEWKRKRDQSHANPKKSICISLDGTDQFPNGFPSFLEQTKADCNGSRLKMHMQIGMCHGGSPEPTFFLGWEDMYGDPNFTTETLHRMLLHEEELRGGKLPPTLYLQLDNCIRENKNTPVMSYLAWLLERNVFKVIYLSFLPVGHTHFENDQVASRVGVCVRHNDIRSVERLIELLKQCYTPAPRVEWVDDVMDWRGLINPTGNRDFPKETSRVIRCRGIATKIDQPGCEHMGGTSPLHWWLRKDINGKVMVQTKFTCDDSQWSVPQYFWND